MASGLQDPVQAQLPDGMAATNGTVPKPSEQSATNLKAKAPREKRPNFAQIHSRPLPVDIYPLPAFIPHNPLSIVRIAIALLSRSVWPPSPHVVIHKAYFSSETQSIHVTDPQSIRAFWEQGFWGSGSLSRSEPRWLDLEKRKRGIKAMQTSEEITQQRRKERRQFKLERARLEREAIEQQRRAEGKSVDGDVTQQPPPEHIDPDAFTSDSPPLEDDTAISKPDTSLLEPKISEDADPVAELPTEVDLTSIKDQEHLQLTLEEAFFLSYVLGVLEIYKDEVRLPSSYLFRLFSAHSVFPIEQNLDQDIPFPLETSAIPSTIIPGVTIAPDNFFVLKYAVFHHFRSLGWVVRSGIKFAVDFLLYNRGPAFSHAEFAVMVLPSYSHPYWSETSQRREECKKKESRDWWWFHRINRVQSLAHKSLMLVYVEVPPPWDQNPAAGAKLDIGAVLKQYKVREFVVGRWTPNRHR